MTIHKITAHMLAQRFGGTVRYWERRRPAMVKAGLLNKIGNSFFGDMLAIQEAVARGGAEIWSA